MMDPMINEDSSYAPKQTYFSPYAMNGGTCLAIAGEDFVVVGSDTRLSQGFSIFTRDLPKTYKLTTSTVLGACGFHGDVLTLTKVLNARLKMFEHEHHKKMTTSEIAAMLSTMLYHRRFFPYYVYNLIAGLDEEGKGVVYSFDPVGSYGSDGYRARGSAAAMLQPLLDNQIKSKISIIKSDKKTWSYLKGLCAIGLKNQQNVQRVSLSKEKVVNLVKDVFISAAERDIYTGDAVVVHVITKDGTTTERFPLRRD